MELWIDPRSGTPIYEQIYHQIKEQIISGALEADQPLPSIRNLAKDLHISVITTKRAYDELEREGLIYTVAAKGCFVAPKNPELLREAQLRQIEEKLREVLRMAAPCRVTGSDLAEMIRVLVEENR